MLSVLVRVRTSAVTVLAVAAAAAVAGCGISEQSPDLFLLKRTGQGSALTLLVKDDGTVRCNGRQAKPLPDPQLLQARDVSSSLDKDAKAGLRIAPGPGSVYSYTVRLQDGTISFPDTAAAAHKELAQAELFTVQVVASRCSGGSGA